MQWRTWHEDSDDYGDAVLVEADSPGEAAEIRIGEGYINGQIDVEDGDTLSVWVCPASSPDGHGANLYTVRGSMCFEATLYSGVAYDAREEG